MLVPLPPKHVFVKFQEDSYCINVLNSVQGIGINIPALIDCWNASTNQACLIMFDIGLVQLHARARIGFVISFKARWIALALFSLWRDIEPGIIQVVWNGFV